jgi:hypothetical protein
MSNSNGSYHFPGRSLLSSNCLDVWKAEVITAFACEAKTGHRQEGSETRKTFSMATCEVCENEYDKAFEVVVAGKHHTFDSFECAIHALAPVCPHCHCRIVGHGVEQGGKIFCCVHCARSGGQTQLKDRV